jgi:predicted permease
MPTRRELMRSLRLLFNRGGIERELDAEMAYHVEMRAQELVAAGVSPGDARRRAETEMGGSARLKQDLRDVHGVAFAGAIDALRSDFRVALRRISRAPGFAAAMILSVAITIAANATIYTAVRSLLLAPLGVADVDRLVWLSSSAPGESARGGLLDWEAQGMERQRDIFPAVAVVGDRSFVRQVGTQRSRWHGLWVTPRLADLLRIRPALGRAFTMSDVAAGAPVMMISHERWTTDLGADSAVVGRILHFIDNKSFLVIGVLPPGLEFPFGRSPRSGDGAGYSSGVQDFWFLGQGGAELPGGTTIARIGDGVSIDRAQSAAATIVNRRPPPDANRTVRVTPVREAALGVAAPGLRLALAFAVLMLALAAANLANLTLLRLRSRATELAVMGALGGSRLAVARTIVVESVLLVGIGTIAGVLVAAYTPQVLRVLSAGTLPMLDRIRMDWTVAMYTAAVALLVAVVSGLIPALLVSRRPLAQSISVGGRAQTEDPRMRRFRAGLVVVQVALAFVLSIGAGLITTSFGRLTSVDTGYQPEGVIAADVEVFDHPDVVGFYRQLDQRLRAIPGVEAVGLIHSTPLTGKWTFTEAFEVAGRAYPPEGGPQVAGSIIAFDYFGAMGIPVMSGRSFTDAEYTRGSPRVIMINESAARRFFPNESPLGKALLRNAKPRQIIGVVKDSRDVRLDAAAEPMWYEPGFGAGTQLIVRSSRDLDEVLPAVRRELVASHSGLVIESLAPFDDIMRGTLSERRLAMRLVMILAVLSTALCLVGLYGVLAYAVRQRRREFGIRSALGARRRALLGAVVQDGMAMVAIGVVIGVAVAVAGTRLIAGLLYDLDPLHSATFVRIVALFAVTAGAATLLPGIAAMRTDPAIALRDE